ncbi:DNA-binding SARP family transcriptional activator [Kibdelosporangium banguiense]|uniref:DNA-binding SARP family transcriptional activator n=1 Tax=Kibdelosporangium banguiense TaxID=1365924 RepID=A0ABS4TGG6_9PSEU|nr:AfsR/SARP family transcriptional regulator [Kibdelosporangium banguiense]MBP2323520.1 DNA-binding SARP family transcriptional activator [Kibdelosporangium banguiense]
MMFRLLGPLDVCGPDGASLPITQHKQRTLLSLLLLTPGNWVSTDLIHETLWVSDSPRNAFGNMKTYVSQLRRKLIDANDLENRIESRVGGYRVFADRHELDVFLFEEAARKGREALQDGDPGRAIGHLQAALDLWRGEPFEELPVAVKQTESTRLEEHRWAVREDLIDAHVALGQHHVVIPTLRALTMEYPTREHVWYRLLVALCQSGRRAEALAAYQTAYRFLAEELGIEPGAELRQLHQQMLTGDLTGPFLRDLRQRQ